MQRDQFKASFVLLLCVLLVYHPVLVLCSDTATPVLDFSKTRMENYAKCTQKLAKIEGTIQSFLEFEEPGQEKNRMLDSSSFYSILKVQMLPCNHAFHGKESCSKEGLKMVKKISGLIDSKIKSVYGCKFKHLPKAMLLHRGRVMGCELESLLKDIRASKDECQKSLEKLETEVQKNGQEEKAVQFY